MGLVVAITAGLVTWLVMWSLDVKAIDAFLITTVIILVASMARILAPSIPGNRSSR
jgi:hypothetical protein